MEHLQDDIPALKRLMIRRTIQSRQKPEAGLVRIEEMVNYFPYAYAAPEGDAAFASTISVMPPPGHT